MMNFIWPYIKGPSVYNKMGTFYELKYSVATVQKFYPGARCIVVGDKPDFDVEYIEVERISTAVADVRHVDIINKLKHVIDVVDDFVLMYDDIFFLQPISKRDLVTPYALCKIDDLATYNRGKGGMLYSRLWNETYKRVALMTDEMYDWETHLPRFLESDRVRFLIDNFDLMNNNLIITSLYGTMWWDNPVLLTEDDTIRSHVDMMGPSVDLDKEFSRKFLIIDDNSCTPSMTGRIKELVE